MKKATQIEWPFFRCSVRSAEEFFPRTQVTALARGLVYLYPQEEVLVPARTAPARLAAQVEGILVARHVDHDVDAFAGLQRLLQLELQPGGGDVHGGAVEG